MLQEVGVCPPGDPPGQLGAHLLCSEVRLSPGAAQVPAGQAAVVAGAVFLQTLEGLAKLKVSRTSTLLPM